MFVLLSRCITLDMLHRRLCSYAKLLGRDDAPAGSRWSADRCGRDDRVVLAEFDPGRGVAGRPGDPAHGGVGCGQRAAGDAVVVTAQQQVRFLWPGPGRRHDDAHDWPGRAAAGAVGHDGRRAGRQAARCGLNRRAILAGWLVPESRVHIPSIPARDRVGRDVHHHSGCRTSRACRTPGGDTARVGWPSGWDRKQESSRGPDQSRGAVRQGTPPGPPLRRPGAGLRMLLVAGLSALVSLGPFALAARTSGRGGSSGQAVCVCRRLVIAMWITVRGADDE